MSRSLATRPSVLVLMLSIAALSAKDALGQEPFRSWCGAGLAANAGGGWTWLPQGRLFCPLAADPKGQRSFMTYLRGDFATIANPAPGAKTHVGAVGLADGFSIFRVAAEGTGAGIQLDLEGSVFSQFNLDAFSWEMINADYLVGLPLTFRTHGLSGRLRFYHQSSHLGDEFILDRQPERLNLSFESLELILSQEMGPLRVYGGGETLVSREPSDVAAHLVHGGLEVRPVVGGSVRLMAAVDLKVVDAQEWQTAWSTRVGIELARIGPDGHPPRVVTLIGEFYDGLAPYGQFYRDNIRYFGGGFSVTQ